MEGCQICVMLHCIRQKFTQIYYSINGHSILILYIANVPMQLDRNSTACLYYYLSIYTATLVQH